MGYLEDKQTQAKALIGKRVEIPIHYDMWMRGARFGVVHSVGKGGEFVRVRLDHPQARKLLKVWRLDFDYMRVLGEPFNPPEPFHITVQGDPDHVAVQHSVVSNLKRKADI